MNHYPRHVGDFIRDTVGLSLAERGAYTALLDQYYASEKPLPLDSRERYRMAGAVTKAERSAVDYVVGRYFKEQADGWHQKRADLEIEAYRERSAKARDSVGVRWSKRNTFVLPTNDPSNSNQNQEPVTSKEKVKGIVGLAPDDAPKPPAGKELRDAAKRVLDCLNRNAGRKYEPVDANINPILARMREGYTERELCAIAAVKARQWKGDERMEAYVRPKTLYNATNAAQYRAELPSNRLEATE